MSNAWQNYHRRAAVVRQVLHRIERSRDGALPWDETTATVFTDRNDLLTALHQVWSNRLGARVDLALETGSGHPQDAVRGAWRDLASRLPGLRRVLDGHADDPALAHQRRVEHRLLAVAAGLASLDDPTDRAAAAGARLADSATPVAA